jgi:hypothetical protein
VNEEKWSSELLSVYKFTVVDILKKRMRDSAGVIYVSSQNHSCSKPVRDIGFHVKAPTLYENQLIVSMQVRYCKDCRTIEIYRFAHNYRWELITGKLGRLDRRGFAKAVLRFLRQ